MAKDKYDFIQEILGNKNLTLIQRERVLLLIKEEIKTDGNLGKNLDDRLKKLEKMLHVGPTVEIHKLNQEPPNQLSLSKQKDLPKYYYPSGLYKYLFDYNQNPILKSTCHEIDSDELKHINEYCKTETYDYEKHLEKIIEAFKEHDKNHFAPATVKSLIRGYITGKDYYEKPIEGWSSNNFKINWSCDSLKNWCLQNPDIPPNPDRGFRIQKRNSGFEINPNISLRNGTVIQKFSDLVINFKYLFHIRSSNPLKKIIINENSIESWNTKIDFQINDSEFPINIEFFTDVDKLIQAYNRIIQLIIELNTGKEAKAKVQLILTENDESIKLSILHKGSVYGKSVKNTAERLGTTYENLIKNQVNGLCNFYVFADFESGEAYKIGIWDKPNLWKTESPVAQRLEKAVGGVEHIFELVKPKTKK